MKFFGWIITEIEYLKMKVILTEEQLKKIVSESVSEVSNQTLTNSLIAAAKKSNKYYDSGDNGMATSKMRQSDRLYDELDAKLNPSEDLNKRVKRCYFSDETATIVNGVNSYEIAGRDGNNVMGFVQVLLARENKRAYYRIIINSETRQIEKESEDDLMEDILRRVSDKALQEYNKAKNGIKITSVLKVFVH